MANKPRQPLRIRSARVDDAAAIAPLLGELGYQATADEVARRLAGLLPRDDANVLVVEIDEELVALAAFQIIELLERAQPQCRITALVVRSDARRRGAATALLDTIEAAARRHNCFRLEVTTRPHRSEAHELYAALGFHERPHRLVKPLAID
jgi:ribosomal protein S18 acetylase RimI-like enzyme